MTLEEYLNQHFLQSTAKGYGREINNYKHSTPSSESATYKDIVAYLGNLRKQNQGRCKLQLALQSIKQYYFFLMQTGQRKDHPCRNMTLRDKQSQHIQLQDLFTEQELALLLDRQEHYKILELRNKTIISLLIYQGLTTGELVSLTVEDIHLEKGTLDIKGTSITNRPAYRTGRRTVGLQTTQIMLLHQYLEKVRPALLKRNKLPSRREGLGLPAGQAGMGLILSWQGGTANGDGIHYLVSTYKHLFPGRNLNPRTIRQSVITNLLKQGKDLRLVQVYAGHKSPDTTEKYKQSQIAQLKAEIEKYHPLK